MRVKLILPTLEHTQFPLYLLFVCLMSVVLDCCQMLQADRRYWGIETGLHLRLEVIASEDRSRVRHRTSALNLATTYNTGQTCSSVDSSNYYFPAQKAAATSSRFSKASLAETSSKSSKMATNSSPR